MKRVLAGLLVCVMILTSFSYDVFASDYQEGEIDLLYTETEEPAEVEEDFAEEEISEEIIEEAEEAEADIIYEDEEAEEQDEDLLDEELIEDESVSLDSLSEEIEDSEEDMELSADASEYLIISRTKVTGFVDGKLPSKVVIPEGITEIGEDAFKNATTITEVEFPKSLKIIGAYAFNGCTGLTKIDFPSSVTTIGDFSFSNTGISKLSIETNVKTLGKGAFSWCSNLTEATIGSENIGDICFQSCEKLSKVYLLNVALIGSSAFAYCNKKDDNYNPVDVLKLTLSNSMTVIPDNFLKDLDAQRCDVVIPANVTKIGNNAFAQGTSPDGWYDFMSFAFAGNKVKIIGDNAFKNVKINKGINLPDSVEEIGNEAFSGGVFGEAAVDFYLPKNLKTIKGKAFANAKMATLYIPSGVTSIYPDAFGDKESGLGSIKFVIDGNEQSNVYKKIVKILNDCECYNSENIKYNKGIEKYCRITYVMNGGYFDYEVPTLFESNQYILFNHGYAPKRTGYYFDGWYLDSRFNNELEFELTGGKLPYKAKTVFQNNITLYAKWNPNNYTVLFDSNKPTIEVKYNVIGNMENQHITYDKATKLNKNTYSLARWKFTGWNTKADGSGVTYKDMASVKNLKSEFLEEITLYAQWQPITYKVNFDGNTYDLGLKASGRMPAMKYTYYDYNSRAVYLPQNAFTCQGLTFKGWSLRPDASVNYADKAAIGYLLEDAAADNKNAVTLYAVWERNKYNVAFYNENSSGTGPYYSSTEFESGYTLAEAYYKNVKEKELSDIVPYAVVNNFTSLPNGKGTKYKIDSKICLNAGDTLKLYFTPKYIVHNLEVNMNGGKGGIKLPKTYTHYTEPFILAQADNLPTKAGYVFSYFEGTRDDRDPGKCRIKPGDKFEPEFYDNNSKITARWTLINYAVYLDPNSKSYKEGSLNNTDPYKCDGKTYTYIEAIDLYDNSEKSLKDGGAWIQTNRTEYSITGWSTKPDGRGKVFANGIVNVKDLISYANGIDPKDEKSTKITLYAVWSPKKYNISYYDSDGSVLSSSPKTYTYNEKKPVKIGTPKKTGYKFKKWIPKTATSIPWLDADSNTIKAGANCNISLQADWEAIKYTVVFDPNSRTAEYVSGEKQYENRAYDDSGAVTDVAKYSNPGYTFAGYNTKANGKGVNLSKDLIYYTFGGLSTRDGSTVKVYAQWIPSTYSITYNTEGIVTNSNPKEYTYAPTGTLKLKNPTRYGYVFDGWYTDAAYTEKVTSINKNAKKAFTLYAKWRLK